MKPESKNILFTSVLVITGLYFLFNGLEEAKGFLAPLSIAVLLSMVFTPLSQRFEKWGINRGLSSFFCVLITVIAFLGLFTILTVEGNKIAEDWPRIQKQVQPKIEQFQQFVEDNTGISVSKQNDMFRNYVPGNSISEDKKKYNGKDTNSSFPDVENTKSSVPTGESSSSSQNVNVEEQNNHSQFKGGVLKVFGFLGQAFINFLSFLGTSLLVFIYIFFLLLYRKKIKNSILNFFKKESRDEAEKIFNESITVSQSYLVGRLLLILFLAVLYSIGLGISGIKSPILISVIAAFLSLLPYVGVLVGFILALIMAAITGNGSSVYIGVTITYVLAQFIESYILEPYLVGKKVNLNPLITIVIVVLGGSVWGLTGMIISIPLFGILKGIFDHISALQPFGYLLGDEDTGSGDEKNYFEKAAEKMKNKFS